MDAIQGLATSIHGIAKLGFKPLSNSVAGGQYTESRGLFFGGRENQWELNSLLENLRQLLRSHDPLFVVDIHTGLGSWSHDTIYLDRSFPKSLSEHLDNFERGHVVQLGRDASLYEIRGSWSSGLYELFPNANYLLQEFGTQSFVKVLYGLIQENYQHHFGDKEARLAAGRYLLQCFYPDDAVWKRRVLTRARQVFTLIANFQM
jgi:hypothetical protein